MSNNTRRKKVIRWVLIIFILIVMIGVGVILKTIADTQKKMADFISEHPEETAVVTYTFDENGNVIDDGKIIFHNADKPLVVASVMKTVVLAAYADIDRKSVV